MSNDMLEPTIDTGSQTDPGSGILSESPAGASNRIRLRAVVLGLILALGICVVTPFNNIYRQGTLLGGGHFPLAPFFILIWLTLLVAGISRAFKIVTLIKI